MEPGLQAVASPEWTIVEPGLQAIVSPDRTIVDPGLQAPRQLQADLRFLQEAMAGA